MLLLAGVAAMATAGLEPPENLRVQHLRSSTPQGPPVVDVPKPLFTWSLTSETTRGAAQSAYELQMATDEQFLHNVLFTSGVVSTNRTATDAVYPRGGWLPATRYHWRVRWHSGGRGYSGGDVSPWSTAKLDFGLRTSSDWQGAEWVACGSKAGAAIGSCLARCEFHIRSDSAAAVNITRATLYAAAAGWFEARLNGQKLGGDVALEPGWTQWNRRVEYVAYDVPVELLARGGNVLGLMLGRGWPGHLGLTPATKAVMGVETSDGKRAFHAATGSAWTTSAGPITSNDIYNGERYDARAEQRGWDTVSFNDEGWAAAAVARVGNNVSVNAVLSARVSEPIRKAAVLRTGLSVKFVEEPGRTPDPSGAYIVDMGQNMAGWVRLDLPAQVCTSGTKITLRHAEYLRSDGTLYVGNLRSAKQTDTYICSGATVGESYDPRFTYHGFRYVEVSGWPVKGGPTLAQVRARAVHSGVEESGRLSFGDGTKGMSGFALLNQLQSNIRWTQLDNLHSVPTDCDQRNERQGWMADASVSSEEAFHNFGMAALYSKWLQDMLDVQATPASVFEDCNPKSPIYPDCNGTVTDTTPHVPGLYGNRPADPSWGAAFPLISCFHWRYTGDVNAAARHYAGVKLYVDWLSRAAAGSTPNGLVTYHWYGDWLEPQKVASDEAVSKMTSAFNFLFGLKIAADMGAALGEEASASDYTERFAAAAAVYNAQWYDATKQLYGGGSQAEQVYPLFVQIVPGGAAAEAAVADALINDILRTRDTHLNTGIISTKWLFPLLSRIGRADVGLAALLQRTDPSWGFMVASGATTIWEHWNAYHNPSGDGMSSHNHPAFASVGAWMYQSLAGIKLDDSTGGGFQPAFQRAVLEPECLDFPPLPAAAGSVDSPIGTLALSWNLGAFDGGARADAANIGAGWRLVRRVAAGDSWHPAVDQLIGTAVYDDGKGTFSHAFADADFDQFLFATGDLQKWLIAERTQIQRPPVSREFVGTIVRSSLSPTNSTAKWWHRAAITNPEDPWVSLVDHEEAVVSGDILYGENSYGGQQANATLPVHNGANVYIRKASAVTLSLNATVPVSAMAELRLSRFGAATADTMVVSEQLAGVVWQHGVFVGSGSGGITAGAKDGQGRVCLQLGSGSYMITAVTGA